MTYASPKDRALAAIREFRSMVPMLSGYARAFTGQRVRVQIGPETSTDGKTIFIRPPMALADNIKHNKDLCRKYDHEGVQLCKACMVREDLLFEIFHEIGHISEGSFEALKDSDKAWAVRRAAEALGENPRTRKLGEQIERIARSRKISWLDLAAQISPFMAPLVNAFDDARINYKIGLARPGTRRMRRSSEWRIVRDGVKSFDPKTGEEQVRLFRECGLNHQMLIALYCMASGDHDVLPRAFCDEVVKAASDERIVDLCAKTLDDLAPRVPYALAVEAFVILREYGFFHDPSDDFEDEEEQEQEESLAGDPEESDADDSDEDSSDEDFDEDFEDEDFDEDSEDSDEFQDEESEEESGEDSDSDEGDGESGDDGDTEGQEGASADTDDTEDLENSEGDEFGDDVTEEDGNESDDEGTEGSPCDDAGPEGDGVDADDDNAGEACDHADEASQGTAGYEPELPESEYDMDEESEGDLEDPDGDAGSGSRESDDDSTDRTPGSDMDDLDAEEAPDGDGDESSIEQGDDASSAADDRGDAEDGGADGEAEADQSASDGSGTGGESDEEVDAEGDDEQVDGTGEGAADRDEIGSSMDSTSSGEGEGALGDDEEDSEEPLDPDEDGRDWGSASDSQDLLDEVFGHHPHKFDDELDPEVLEEVEAMRKAVVVTGYFDEHPRNVAGVCWHKEDDHKEVAGMNAATAWTHSYESWGMYHGIFSREELGIDGDFEPAEATIGSTLMRARLAFSQNRRTRQVRNLKAGKVDRRVLGKRAPLDDPRLFHKTRRPGRRDYFVLIGMDVSGSTRGRELVTMKQSVMAEAEVLSRLGVNFSVFCHSGKGMEVDELFVDIYEIKAPEEPWNNATRRRLSEIGPDAGNLDGHTLELYRKVLDTRNETDRILQYYTDGRMPATNGPEELEVLKRNIGLCKDRGYTLMAVAVGTDSPREHGFDTVRIDGPEDVPSVVEHLGRRLQK